MSTHFELVGACLKEGDGDRGGSVVRPGAILGRWPEVGRPGGGGSGSGRLGVDCLDVLLGVGGREGRPARRLSHRRSRSSDSG